MATGASVSAVNAPVEHRSTCGSTVECVRKAQSLQEATAKRRWRECPRQFVGQTVLPSLFLVQHGNM